MNKSIENSGFSVEEFAKIISSMKWYKNNETYRYTLIGILENDCYDLASVTCELKKENLQRVMNFCELEIYNDLMRLSIKEEKEKQ